MTFVTTPLAPATGMFQGASLVSAQDPRTQFDLDLEKELHQWMRQLRRSYDATGIIRANEPLVSKLFEDGLSASEIAIAIYRKIFTETCQLESGYDGVL